MAEIVIQANNVGADAGPFEVYIPNAQTGTKVGNSSYTKDELETGISLTVDDSTTILEVLSKGLRCGQNKAIPVNIERISVPVPTPINVPVGDPVPDSTQTLSVVIRGKSTVDTGVRIELIADAPDASNNATYSWSGTDGSSYTGESIRVIKTSDISITYSVTVTDGSRSATDTHSVTWGVESSDYFEEKTIPTITNIRLGDGITGGTLTIDWGDTTSGERIKITPNGPSGYGSIVGSIVQIANKATTTYDVNFTGNINPGVWSIPITFTVSSDSGASFDERRITVNIPQGIDNVSNVWIGVDGRGSRLLIEVPNNDNYQNHSVRVIEPGGDYSCITLIERDPAFSGAIGVPNYIVTAKDIYDSIDECLDSFGGNSLVSGGPPDLIPSSPNNIIQI